MCQARIPFCCGIVALALTAQGNATGAEEVSFELDVQPILAVRGCNQGACHGKARGQNGFQLSLLGFDSNFDFSSIAQQSRGRRVFPAAPAQSLLLRKATAQVPHGGGQRFAADSEEYQLLQRWIAQGAPRRISNESKLVRVELSPKSVYLQTDAKAQLAVKAFYSDGSTRDVTDCTQFQSNEDATVSVNANGIVKAGSLPGEATIMARYMNNIETSLVSIPLSGNVAAAEYEKLPRSNFIDELVWNKLQTLGITPAELCDDAKYLRRIHIDLIGRLPTPDEDRAFLASDAPDKRTRAVDTLLERPEYADHWASKWADLLRPNPYRVGIKAVINYDQTIRDAFRKNLPYDQFVRQLVTAQGSTWHDGATVLYRDRREPEEVTTLVSQLFLGIRLECAKCHHHPFEKWSQDDFYSFAAFFGRVGRVGGDLSPPISGEEEMIFVSPTGVVKHPLTEKAMQPRVLFGKMPAIPADADPR
ncbi:MAG: DUF1549 domain-containing protein, partial [Planctomycetota bacterium]|nr:DUF1549 domain-containing protein [Planctomycetota bacterium]